MAPRPSANITLDQRPADSGIYITVFHLPRGRRIRVGKLGQFRFTPGYYLYVGSAQRNLSARLDRHGRRRKPLRWHIDYFSTRARMYGAIWISAPRPRECRLARKLGRLFTQPAPGFGASDCNCPSHLFYTPELP